MAVDMLTYQHGFTALYRGVHHLACPHCGHRMQVYRQPASEHSYPDGVGNHLVGFTKCLNPNCPYLGEHKEQTEMGTTLTAEKVAFESIPTGEYLGECIDWSPETGQYGDQIKLIFEIVAPKAYEGKQRFGWCSKKLTTGNRTSKLWKWTEALYNRALAIGEQVDLDNLLHRRCILVIVEEPRKVSADDDEPGTIAKIMALKPYKKQEPMPAASANGKSAPAAQEADEFEIGSKDDPFVDE